MANQSEEEQGRTPGAVEAHVSVYRDDRGRCRVCFQVRAVAQAVAVLAILVVSAVLLASCSVSVQAERAQLCLAVGSGLAEPLECPAWSPAASESPADPAEESAPDSAPR